MECGKTPQIPAAIHKNSYEDRYMKSFDEIFEDRTKYAMKITTNEYQSEGTYPIIDQGQKMIAAYTDLESGVFVDVPAIIFGDHTRTIKYIERPFFLGADGVKVLRSKIESANYRYLYYALRNAKIPDTGYNRHYKWLKGIQIRYIEPEKQQNIVDILDKIEWIIANRKCQLEEINTLIKSRFVEMFGDPVSNLMGWKQSSIGSVCVKITDGEHGSVPRSQSGHIFLNAKHIRSDGNIDFGTVTYIDSVIHERIYKRCNPEQGDILLTTTGTIGNVAIVPPMEEFSMDRGITLLKLDKAMCDCIFIAALLRCESMQNIMKANVHASAIGHLFLNKVMKLPVIVPPMRLQEQFATFVSQSIKLKLEIQKSLNETQTLMDALMQKYFG